MPVGGKEIRYSRGFTLVELSVVIVIMAIMTAVILANIPDMRSNLSLDAIAQEMAINIRSAQVYSRSTRITYQNLSSNVPYGVNFDITNRPSQFVLFADTNESNNFEAAEDGYKEWYSLQGGYAITSVKFFDATGAVVDSTTENFSVMYIRPGMRARFYDADGGTSSIEADYADLCIGGGKLNKHKLLRLRKNGSIEIAPSLNNECTES